MTAVNYLWYPVENNIVQELEPVSKPSEHDHHTGKFGKAVKEERVEFVAGDQPAKVLQPGDGPLNDPAAAVATQGSAVLSWRFYTPTAMRADQLNPSGCQSLAERVAVGGPALNEPPGYLPSDSLVDQGLDESDFCRAGAFDIDSKRQAG